MSPEPTATGRQPLVLGLHAFGHEAGVCLVGAGGLWALSEERLSRRKYDDAFPRLSLNWALDQAGLADINQVELVVFDLLEGAAGRIMEHLEQLGYRGRVRAIRHHLAHAASAFYCSPFSQAAVLTIDAGGSREGEGGPGHRAELPPGVDPAWREVQGSWLGDDLEMRLRKRIVTRPPWTVNVGVLYGLVSVYLGFGSMGAGKVMGLAAHGKLRKDLVRDLFQRHDGTWLARCPYEDPLSEPTVSDFLPSLFAGLPARRAGEPLGGAHREVAARVQQLCQDIALATAQDTLADSGQSNLCLAGGFFLNAPTNSAIAELPEVAGLFVQPAATDAGIPLGCALWGYHQLLGRPRLEPLASVALGGAYRESEIKKSLDALEPGRLLVSEPGNIAAAAAQALAEGKIVGWFQGRSEFGPRALGHRSILADPGRPEVVEKLNQKIKFREPFRPYAPAVTTSAGDEYFQLPAPSPFMLLLGKVRESWRARLPAICHVDGSARVQTVDAASEPLFHSLLEEFAARTGVPVLLNTSFNRAGEPIVETPGDALEVFLHTELDALALGNMWIRKASRCG